MAEVSRNLVAILLVLVIIVSAIGTWSLFNSKANVEYSIEYTTDRADTGYVALSIPKVPQSAAAVQLDIASEVSSG